MGRRDPRESRFLGLWTAVWLGIFLLGGLLWLGDLSLQWPVLAVPVLWAMVAARPRRRRAGLRKGESSADAHGYRTDTVERPALRPPRRRDGER